MNLMLWAVAVYVIQMILLLIIVVDEVDIVGCGSLSDNDDHGSNSSDGGYTVNSRS